jgi:hypothetical protein
VRSSRNALQTSLDDDLASSQRPRMPGAAPSRRQSRPARPIAAVSAASMPGSRSVQNFERRDHAALR